MPAGTSGPDLTFAQSAVEDLFDDRCDITRSTVTGTNTTTLALTTSASTVASDVHCSVREENKAADTSRPGGGTQAISDYIVSVPLGTATIQRGDLITITAARRDASLVGKTFRVIEAVSKSFALSRKLYCELVTAIESEQD